MASSSLSSLPLDLVEEIFRKAPIESLVRFKTTSKQWYAFFNDTRSIYKLLDLSQERFIRVHKVNHESIRIFNPDTEALLRLPTPGELHNYRFRKTIHCDGLLLCDCIIERGRNTIRKLAVWNPILSRVKWIEPSDSYKPFDIYRFGYDNASRDNYKILRIGMIKFGKSSEIEIYEFKSKLWRSVDHAATLECNALLESWHSKALSMYGNIYWAVQKKTVKSESDMFIQSFDFSTETFMPICFVPKRIDYSSVCFDHLVLSGLGGDKLSLLYQDINLKTEVWVTNKVTDEIVSWIKYFSVTPDPPLILHSSSHLRFPTYFIHKTNKIMLWCEELDVKTRNMRTSVCQMGEGDEILKQVEMSGRQICYKSCDVYVPSLVPVPK